MCARAVGGRAWRRWRSSRSTGHGGNGRPPALRWARSSWRAVADAMGPRDGRQRRRWLRAALITAVLAAGTGLASSGAIGGPVRAASGGGSSSSSSSTEAGNSSSVAGNATGQRSRQPAETTPSGGPWRLVLDDEMDDPVLFSWLWRTCYDWGCRIPTNPEHQWYQAANATEAGGSALLTARQQPSHGQPFTSGMLQSNGRFEFTYGEVAIRAKLPATAGTWPALWLAAANGSWPPEIDVMENWGDDPSRVQQTVITGSPPAAKQHAVIDPTLVSGFHTYALDWEPGRISWYVDGTLRYQVDVSIDTPMYPIMNLAVADPPSASTVRAYPATFAIDWVRVYQHPDVGTSHCALATCVQGDGA